MRTSTAVLAVFALVAAVMLCGVFAQEDAPCDVNMDEGSGTRCRQMLAVLGCGKLLQFPFFFFFCCGCLSFVLGWDCFRRAAAPSGVLMAGSGPAPVLACFRLLVAGCGGHNPDSALFFLQIANNLSFFPPLLVFGLFAVLRNDLSPLTLARSYCCRLLSCTYRLGDVQPRR